ncbi:MAG: beta-propeller fold lactonase family protein [Candidatus Cybelea sp.]
MKGSPFPTGYTQPLSVAIDGTFVYVGNYGSNNLTEYVIAKKSGALTLNGVIGTGNYPIGVAVDPTGKFLYVSDHFGRDVSAYAINSSDGLLIPGGAMDQAFVSVAGNRSDGQVPVCGRECFR